MVILSEFEVENKLAAISAFAYRLPLKCRHR